MRELTLLQTGFLAGGLLLCLVLPLLMSFRGPTDAVPRRRCMKIVWAGQAALTVAGLLVLIPVSVAPYAATLGLLIWMTCVGMLLRQLRAARTAIIRT